MRKLATVKCLLHIVAAIVLLGAMPVAAADKSVNGYVPDKQTAISIASAVWTPIYGAENIEKQKPYIATLKDGKWDVRGSLPEHTLGGVVEITINKADGKILRVSHGK